MKSRFTVIVLLFISALASTISNAQVPDPDPQKASPISGSQTASKGPIHGTLPGGQIMNAAAPNARTSVPGGKPIEDEAQGSPGPSQVTIKEKSSNVKTH